MEWWWRTVEGADNYLDGSFHLVSTKPVYMKSHEYIDLQSLLKVDRFMLQSRR